MESAPYSASYEYLLKLEDRYRPTHEFDPEGAERAYTVAELLEGVRWKRSMEREDLGGSMVTIVAGPGSPWLKAAFGRTAGKCT